MRRDAGRGAATIGVAVSGGADSVFLLRRLVAVWRPGFPRLAVISIDHTLRGEASQADVAFVARLAAELSLPFRALRADPDRVGTGSEGALRAERYRLFALAAREMCCDALYLGHHAGDQVESIVLAALRGAGLRGLGGMRRRRPLEPGSRVAIVRPLLAVSGSSIRAELMARGLPFRDDPSNHDLRYLRNRIRHVVLPELHASDSERFEGRMLRLGRWARVAWRAAVRRAARGGSDSDALRARLLEAAGRDIARGATRAALQQLATTGFLRGDVARGIRIRGDAANLRREPPAAASESTPAAPGDYRIREFVGARRVARLLAAFARLGPTRLRDHLARRHVLFADPSAIEGPLVARTRLPGDRFTPFGRVGPKKLKDLLIDRHVPPARRDRLVVLADRRGIVAVESLPIAARVALRADSERILRIRFVPAAREPATD